MKIVVQNKKSRLFWKDDSSWTTDLTEAQDFDTTTHAQRFCLSNQWNDVQIVLKFDSVADVVISV